MCLLFLNRCREWFHCLRTLFFSFLSFLFCNANSLPAETAICTAGPGGNPFFDISWLAVEEFYQQGSGTEAPQHGPKLTYLPNLQATLISHMHSNYKMGYANSKTGYHSYYQSLLPHVHKGISNALSGEINVTYKQASWHAIQL